MKSDDETLRALDIAREAVEKLVRENQQEGAVFGLGYTKALEWVLGLSDSDIDKILSEDEDDIIGE